MLIHDHQRPDFSARTVVVGASGFIGDAVCRALHANQAKVVSISRAQADLTAQDGATKLSALLKDGDCVVTAAAVAPCKNSAMLRENVTLIETILTALSTITPSHVINISSDAIYGDETVPLTEASAMAPGSLHGVMHLCREIMMRDALTCPVAMVRPTLVFGARDPHGGYGPNQFRRKANSGGPVELFGNGEERRDHVLIDDVADLISRIVGHRSHGTLNIATGTLHSFRSIAEMVVALAPGQVEIVSKPRSGPMPHNGYRAFDPSAVKEAFPDFQFTPLDIALSEAQKNEYG